MYPFFKGHFRVANILDKLRDVVTIEDTNRFTNEGNHSVADPVELEGVPDCTTSTLSHLFRTQCFDLLFVFFVISTKTNFLSSKDA